MTFIIRSIAYLTIAAVLLGKPLPTKGQTSFNSAGENIITSGHSMTYAVGEVVNSLHYGSNYNVKNGVIQPEENIINSNAEITKLPATVFPIPAHDFLHIQSAVQTPMFYTIYGIEGTLIMHGTLSGNVICIADLPPASYILSLTTQNQKSTQLIIKL
jgi:hypothetical protein